MTHARIAIAAVLLLAAAHTATADRLRTDKDSVRFALYLMSAVQAAQDDNWGKAASQVQKALDIFPKSHDARNMLAECWIKLGKEAPAEVLLTGVLAEDDRNTSAHHLLGTLRVGQDRYEEALSCFRAAFSIDSSRINTATCIALTYLLLEDIDHAMDAVAVLEKLSPEKADEIMEIISELQQS